MISAEAPTADRIAKALAVLAAAPPSKAAESTTRGTSGTLEIWWPRARRRGATEEAARAEAVANRLL